MAAPQDAVPPGCLCPTADGFAPLVARGAGRLVPLLRMRVGYAVGAGSVRGLGGRLASAAFAAGSNARAWRPSLWSRFAEPGDEALDALSVVDYIFTFVAIFFLRFSAKYKGSRNPQPGRAQACLRLDKDIVRPLKTSLSHFGREGH